MNTNALGNAPENLNEDPTTAVEWVLDHITCLKDQLDIPIDSFKQATGGLKRRGVTFLVILKEKLTGKSELVPLRVEHESVLYHRFCPKADLKNWNGRHIHPIKVERHHDFNDLLRKVKECLKAAWHHFKRRLEKIAHKKARAEGKAARKSSDTQVFRRVHVPQVAYH